MHKQTMLSRVYALGMMFGVFLAAGQTVQALEHPDLLWRLRAGESLQARAAGGDGAVFPDYSGKRSMVFPAEFRLVDGPTETDRGVYAEFRERDRGRFRGIPFVYDMWGNVNLFSGTLSVHFQILRGAGGGLLEINSAEQGMHGSDPLLSVHVDAEDNRVVFFTLGHPRFLEGFAGHLEPQAWHHLLVSWDSNRGRRIYLDGELLAQDPAGESYLTPPALPGRLIFNPGFAIARATLFDGVLPETTRTALFAGEPLPAEPTPDSFSADRRQQELSWDQDLSSLPRLPGDGSEHHLRETLLTEALALANLGWLAVDGRPMSHWPRRYKRYRWEEGGGLHLQWTDGPVERLRLTGSFRGTLHAGAGTERPDPAQALASVEREDPHPLAVLHHRFATPLADGALSFWHPRFESLHGAEADLWRFSRIADLQLYSYGEGRGRLQAAVGRRAFLAPAGPASDPEVEHRLQTHFTRGDRTLIGSSFAFRREPGARVRLSPLRYAHLLTPALPEDFPLAGLRLRLAFEELPEEDLLQVVVHHPVNRAARAAVYDLRLEPGEEAVLDLTLDLRGLVLPAGRRLQVSLITRRGGVLRCGGDGESFVELIQGDAQQVREEYLAAQMKNINEYFLSISELGPWWYIGGSAEEYALAGAHPVYDELNRMLHDARRLAPDCPDLWALFIFTHPSDPRNRDYAYSLPIPEEDGLPEWALLARETLRLTKHQMRWWLEHKLTPNGELGKDLSDDSVFNDEMAFLAVITEEPELAASALRLTDWIHDPAAFDHPEIMPYIMNGLNRNTRGSLHAYEQGINVLGLAPLLEYGDPVHIERVMATARRYDWLYPRGEIGRHKAGAQYNTGRILNPREYAHGYALRPGLTLLWYNENPTVKNVITEYADYLNSGANLEGAGEDVLFAAWRHTGNTDYLRRVGHGGWRTIKMWDYLDLSDQAEGTLAAFGERDYRQTGLDTRNYSYSTLYSAGYAAYRASGGDKSLLVGPLRHLYARLAAVMPALTYLQQSNDRNLTPSYILDHMFMGGMLTRRGSTYPSHAVSYRGFNDNFAALVTTNSDEELAVTLVNFDAAPQTGALRVWRLAPGEYEVIAGPDRNDDDQPDSVDFRETLRLKRYETIPVTLPARTPYVVRARLLAAGTPLHERPDLAVSRRDIRWDAEADRLSFRVHNIGSVDSPPYRLKISAPSGAILFDQVLRALSAPLNLQPQTVRVELENLRARNVSRILIEIDPDREIEQITRVNNRLEYTLDE